MEKLSNLFKNRIVLILFLFVISRTLLTIFGVDSRNLPQFKSNPWYEWKNSDIPALDIWSVWDSSWYLDIARNGYSPEPKTDIPKSCCGQANYAFYPLYPYSIRFLAILFKNHYLIGLAVSNICLLIASYFLHKLVSKQYSRGVADGTLIFLYLFPTAFVFSGFFSESMFLMLLILSFYFADKNKWFLSGFFGFLMSLTRSIGVFVSIALLWEYLRQRGFNYKKLDKNFFSFLFYPLGPILMMFIMYRLTGDFLAHIHLEHSSWGVNFTNPFQTLFSTLFMKTNISIISLYTFWLFVLLAFNLKAIKFSYFILSMILLTAPLTIGDVGMVSMLRYSIVVFPIPLILALKIKSNLITAALVLILAILQLTFMGFWSNGLFII